MTKTGYRHIAGQFAPIAAALAKLKARNAILDGEAVVLDEQGKADFGALRGELTGGSARLRFYAFDPLELDGADLRPMPLAERKRRLGKLLRGAPAALIEVEALEVDGPSFFEAARKLGLEGIVSKRASAPYRSGRHAAWVKVKCKLGDSFPVIGFAEETGARTPRVGALYVGRRERGRIVYAGKVQIGISLEEATELRRILEPFIRAKPAAKRKVTWLRPEIEAEVAYSNVTAGGMLRHGMLKGLRYDLQSGLAL
jgi:bifunctional non-homologous end joining protein LigD